MITNPAAFAQSPLIPRHQGAFALYVALCTLGLNLFASAQDPTITTFDTPGSIATVGTSINPAGTITGYYQVGFTIHGFVRAVGGTITTFDAPGSVGTWAFSINPAGAITGFYVENFTAHGYLRAPDGTIITFDAPGSIGTWPNSINPTGAITTFDPPGASQTDPLSINPAGEIPGQYADPSFVVHGFLRAADGTITKFDPPGSLFTSIYSINPSGPERDFTKTRNHLRTASCALPMALLVREKLLTLVHGSTLNPA